MVTELFFVHYAAHGGRQQIDPQPPADYGDTGITVTRNGLDYGDGALNPQPPALR